jgi:hypothetical protein
MGARPAPPYLNSIPRASSTYPDSQSVEEDLMTVDRDHDKIERAVDEETSQRLHLDWWALIVASAMAAVLLVWNWLGGVPKIPFKEVVGFLFK